ncbi:MAG: hypothetical protein GMKNLPBB_00724 [Myxococcota bacterium]|nr:hypothetical protein [Myxococcota bacterium]
MASVVGIGGVFFRTRDPAALAAWYKQHLGLPVEAWNGAVFPWVSGGGARRASVWSPFPQDTAYFGPGDSPFMINLMVDDLDAMLAQLSAGGVAVDEHVEESEFGRFGWFTDPDGRRVELWQPPPEKP